MKLHPPKVEIDEKEPFKHALFGRKAFGESLHSLLRNVSEGLVVFVNAPWGTGKTTFAKMWRAHLINEKLEVIYYDAYAADYFDDPFVSFSGEILALLDKRLTDGKGDIEKREFKKTAIEVAKRLTGLGVKVGIRGLTLGLMESAHVSELKEIASEVVTGVSEISADLIEKKIENYAKERESLVAFKECLKRVAKLVREEQGFPLTIVVDELDRCRPDFALGLLERIKHLFDVEGVTFVLLLNQDQIESYIRAVYGESVNANAYLLKFANLFVDLPIKESPLQLQYEHGRKDYCRVLSTHYNFPALVADNSRLTRHAGILADHFDMSLREIEKVYAVLIVYFSSLTNHDAPDSLFVPVLAFMKIKCPAIYAEVRSGTASFDGFMKGTRLDKVELEEINSRRMGHFWEWLLMTDAELEIAKHGPDEIRGSREQDYGYIANAFHTERRRVLPRFCSQLDRFSLKPKT